MNLTEKQKVTDHLRRIHALWTQIRQQTNHSTLLHIPPPSPPPGGGEAIAANSGTECGICLWPAVENPVGDVRPAANMGVLNTAVLRVEGVDYHAGCANFWVNCVQANLPSLKIC